MPARYQRRGAGYANGERLDDGSATYGLVVKTTELDEADVALADARPFTFVGKVQ